MQSADAMGSEAMAKKQFVARLYTIQKGTGRSEIGDGVFLKKPRPQFFIKIHISIQTVLPVRT